MKNIFKIAMGTALLAATAMAGTPQFPFPQNKASKYGHTAKYATPSDIKSHFDKWKKAWYQDKGDGTAWILSPEGTGSTVSEGIAYGMMIMVYMSSTTEDHQAEFDKLYATWKANAMGDNKQGGMNWRVGSGAQGGSASDADFDATLALIMASKQWNNSSYLTAAKSLISWIETSDIDANNSVKAGSNWNPMFNPSYGTLANFKLFGQVSGNTSKWDAIISKAESDLSACQNSKTGLVSDWCDWNSHQPAVNSQAAVGQADKPGFFDDAARTPWRMAWAYNWYGNAAAKKFNQKIADWMYTATNMTASGIMSSYYPDGSLSALRDEFVSSTFVGGMGLAAMSADSPEPYTETVYKALMSMTSCETASGCGEGSVKGEKYYPATLNLLYLLMLTGNMPNFYDMSNFTSFTPDPSLMRSSDGAMDGQQMERGDSTVGVSGFWNWGAYHDKYKETGTRMNPDSGSSPLFYHDGAIYAEAKMEIGPEPEWSQAAADAGTLKYPSAGIAMSFNKAEKGVDLAALGVKYLRVTTKTEGPIRVAILNEASVKPGSSGEGSEPGAYITSSTDYAATTYSMSPCDYGFGDPSKCSISQLDLDVLEWVTDKNPPLGSEIIKCVKGLKFEVKDSKGGYGSVSVKAIEWLDANKQVIDPVKIVGFAVGSVPSGSSTPIGTSSSSGTNPGVIAGSSSSNGMGIEASAQFNAAKISTSGLGITISGAPVNADIAVFNMQGKVIAATKAFFGMAQTISVPNKGVYMVRVGNKISKISVK